MVADLLQCQKKSMTVTESTRMYRNRTEVVTVACLQWHLPPVCAMDDQQSMRPHLLGAIDKRELQPFPTQGKRKPKKPTVQRVPIYCVCRLIDDGSQMIECNCCGEWFHTSCIKVEEKYVIY